MGRSGLKLSEISLGSWITFGKQVDVSEAVKTLAEAYDAGINFFDNAEVYALGESEKVMGQAFRQLGWRRGSYVVSTKFFWGLHDGVNQKNTLNRKRLMEAIDGSLSRLEMDYVDIAYCHRDDPETPIEEIVRVMNDMIVAGKALYWGTSEWTSDRIRLAFQVADRYGWHKPQVEQPQYNMFEREKFEVELAPAFQEFGIGSTIWSPLASGVLSGKYNDGIPEGSRMSLKGMEWLQKGITPERLDAVRKLADIAKELDGTMAQLAIAWCLKNPNVTTVITGASRIEQLRENLASEALVERLDDDVMARIDSILRAVPAVV